MSYSTALHRHQHRIRWESGDWTDDTDQTVLILRNLVAHGGAPVVDTFARSLLEWSYRGFAELGDSGGMGECFSCAPFFAAFASKTGGFRSVLLFPPPPSYPHLFLRFHSFLFVFQELAVLFPVCFAILSSRPILTTLRPRCGRAKIVRWPLMAL